VFGRRVGSPSGELPQLMGGGPMGKPIDIMSHLGIGGNASVVQVAPEFLTRFVLFRGPLKVHQIYPILSYPHDMFG
jgi:hypothetical protein